jgi:PmbA protein
LTLIADLTEIAHKALRLARELGAEQAAVAVARRESTALRRRNGALERVRQATERGLTVRLFVEGRYTSAHTNDLRPEALRTFLGASLEGARLLAPEPCRGLPAPHEYGALPALDLRLDDPARASLTEHQRLEAMERAEAAARQVPGAEVLVSVATGWSDERWEKVLLHSDGFAGEQAGTSFWLWAQAAARDGDGARPEGSAETGARWLGDLRGAEQVGREASERVLARLGAAPAASGRAVMVVENRAARRLAGFLLGPLSGAALHQRRSFLEGRQGQQVASGLLSVTDHPLLPAGLGSRAFDWEGLAARPRPVLEGGVLQGFYLDTFHARKLGLAPTTGEASNWVFAPGREGLEGLVRAVPRGVLVTGFLGGNSNETTGDFSIGVRGFLVEGGQRGRPVSGMNVTGNHLELWSRLVALGDDPCPTSPIASPSLVFDDVQFAGK